MTQRHVLVLNHFAVPNGQPGGTRHTELFGSLDGWSSLIVAARTNPSTREPQPDAPGFRFVPVLPFNSNGIARIGNWASYAVTATWAGLRSTPKPDVVYASSPHLLAGLAGAAIAAARRRPLVLEIRDLWPQVLVDMGQLSQDSVVHRVLAALESGLYRRASSIVVLAEGVGRILRERGIPADKIEYIPNAADPEFFDVPTDRDTCRAQFGFTRFTFVYAGAHGPANGLDQLVRAATDPRLAGTDTVLVGDGVAKADLQALASEIGATNVRFIDAIPKSAVPSLLKAADVCVHCLADVPLFRHGISPNKVFDYMAAGRPVLTNVPGDTTTLVEQSGAGIAVEPGRLADGMIALRETASDALRSIGARGRTYIRQNQTRAAMRRRLRLLLARTVSTEPRSAVR